MKLRALVLVNSMRDLIDGVQCVMGQVPLGATNFAAHQSHRFQFVDQILRCLADVQHPVDLAPGSVLLRHHERL